MFNNGKPVQTTTLDMSVNNVTTSAWQTVLAKASNKYASTKLEIFAPDGSIMQIALGDAAAEVALPYTILPGGTQGVIEIQIPSGTRISVKAIDNNVTTGQLVLNQFA